MRKTIKILCSTFLVALISLGLSTKENIKKNNIEARDILTADMTKSSSGKLIKRANEVAASKVSEVKAQVSNEVEGTRHIRLWSDR